MDELINRGLGFLVTKAARVVTRMYQKELMPLGITVPPATVLGTLHLYGPMTQTEIGAQLYMDKATLSTTIRQLRERKLIETSQVEDDARFALHTLTVSGRELAEQLIEVNKRMEAKLEQLASPETVHQAQLYLATLLQTGNEKLD
jgi:DNA-binding MarR family transcriptional regulator